MDIVASPRGIPLMTADIIRIHSCSRSRACLRLSSNSSSAQLCGGWVHCGRGRQHARVAARRGMRQLFVLFGAKRWCVEKKKREGAKKVAHLHVAKPAIFLLMVEGPCIAGFSTVFCSVILAHGAAHINTSSSINLEWLAIKCQACHNLAAGDGF